MARDKDKGKDKDKAKEEEVKDNHIIEIEVIYAEKEKQYSINLTVLAGCTVLHAIELSGIIKLLPHLNLTYLSDSAEKGGIGIYGKKVTLGTIVKEDDRIEIYRPLLRDPKVARREKAKLTNVGRFSTKRERLGKVTPNERRGH